MPVRDEGYYTEQLIYQRGLYLRAEVENNILKVAFYLAEYLSTDCRKPVYTLYVDKKNDVFKGYDYQTKKWSESMLIRPFFQNGYIRKILIWKRRIQRWSKSILKVNMTMLLCTVCISMWPETPEAGNEIWKILTNWDQCMDRLPEVRKTGWDGRKSWNYPEFYLLSLQPQERSDRIL